MDKKRKRIKLMCLVKSHDRGRYLIKSAKPNHAGIFTIWRAVLMYLLNYLVSILKEKEGKLFYVNKTCI